MATEVVPIEVLLQIAVAVETSEAFLCWQSFVTEAENTLGGVAF